MQEILDIEVVGENYIQTKDSFVQILEIQPINFNLMSALEQKSVLMNFKNLLINLELKIQIQIVIKNFDQLENIKYIEHKRKIDTDLLNDDISKSYINLLINTVEKENINQKRYFLINSINMDKLNNNKSRLFLMTKEIQKKIGLCGNKSKILNKEEIIKILKAIFY